MVLLATPASVIAPPIMARGVGTSPSHRKPISSVAGAINRSTGAARLASSCESVQVHSRNGTVVVTTPRASSVSSAPAGAEATVAGSPCPNGSANSAPNHVAHAVTVTGESARRARFCSTIQKA